MSVTIYFYMINEDPRVLTKTLTGCAASIDFEANSSMTGSFKEEVDLFEPRVLIQIDEYYMNNFNYVKIDELNRYYFVREKRLVRTGLLELHLIEDVRMTWSADVLLSNGFVARTASNLKPFLEDGRRPLARSVTRSVIGPALLNQGQFEVSTPAASPGTDPTIILSVANPGLSSLIRPYSIVSRTDTDWAVDVDPIYTSGAITTFLYALTVDQLAAFYTYLNTTDWANNTAVQRLLVGHGAEGIINVMAYPFKLAHTALQTSKYGIVKDPGQTKHIYMYGEDTGKEGYITYQNCNPIIDFGTFKYKDSADSFLDFEPFTTCRMYIPYCGSIDIPMAVMANGGVTLNYVIDMGTGSCEAIVKGSSPDAYVQIVQGQIGVHVPILSSNANEVTKNTLHSLEQLIQGVIQTGAGMGMMAAGGGGSGMFMQGVNNLMGSIHKMVYNPHTFSSTVTESSLGRALYCDPYCLISRVDDETPANYGDYVGYPYEQIAALNTMTGRCEVSELFGSFSGATAREMDAIRQALREGTIF